MHVMNFPMYSKGTIFLKLIDTSNVASRNTYYYFKMPNKIMEGVREEYIFQDN